MMATNSMGVQTGMNVLDPAGEKVGTVADVLQVQAFSQSSASSGYASSTMDMGTSAYGAGAASDAGTVGEGSIIKVDQGGILGIGAKELYIPFGDVSNVVPNESLTVKCSKDMCADRYGNKPEFLGTNS